MSSITEANLLANSTSTEAPATAAPPDTVPWRTKVPLDYGAKKSTRQKWEHGPYVQLGVDGIGIGPAGNYGELLTENDLELDVDFKNFPNAQESDEHTCLYKGIKKRDVYTEFITKFPQESTRTVKTPHGFHESYTKPANIYFPRLIPEYKGLEFIQGDKKDETTGKLKGIQVVGPGSVFIDENGKHHLYELILDVPVVPISQAFIDAFKQTSIKPKESNGDKVLKIDDSEANQANGIKIIEDFGIIPKGERNTKTVLMTRKLHDIGISEEVREQLILQNAKYEGGGFSESEVARTVYSASNGCQNPMGIDHPDAIFAEFIETEATQTEDTNNVLDFSDIKIPEPYELKDQGIGFKRYKTDGSYKDTVKICDPIIVIARTESILITEDNAGVQVIFKKEDGSIGKDTFPSDQLHEQGTTLAQRLALKGFRIHAGHELDVRKYIRKCSPIKVQKVYSSLGWIPQEKLGFIFSADNSTDPNVVYQSSYGGKSIAQPSARGTLEDYDQYVWLAFLKENPRLVYLVMEAMSASLIKFAPNVAVGRHIYGGSGLGKTTELIIAASTVGLAADPKVSDSYIIPWSMTINAAERLLEQRNDMPIILDELALYSGNNFANDLYTIASGKGKARSSSTGKLQNQKEWRTSLLSSGELSLREKAEAVKYGKRNIIKMGAMVRILDTEIHSNTFKDGKEVDAIKDVCAKYYGTLYPAFIQCLIDEFETNTNLQSKVLEILEAAKKRIFKGRGFNKDQERAACRFALVESTGLLLAQFNLLTGLTPQLVRDAVDITVNDWAPTSKMLGDGERAIDAVRYFYLENKYIRFGLYSLKKGIYSAFAPSEDIRGESSPNVEEGVTGCISKRETVGYIDEERELILFHPHKITEITQMSADAVAEALDKKGWLNREKGQSNRFTRISIDGKRVTMYGVKFDFLEETEETPPTNNVVEFANPKPLSFADLI